jgi:hypothetical protein
MDQQPTPPNSGNPAERPVNPQPQEFRPGAVEQPSAPEVSPAPAGVPAQGQTATPPAKLTTDDVVAAIAAVPGPPTPVPAGMQTPGSAEDVDVIEPEWVAKAEEVVAKHQGDPYGEEEAIEDLQQDYLQKRYGHNVADPNSDKT